MSYQEHVDVIQQFLSREEARLSVGEEEIFFVKEEEEWVISTKISPLREMEEIFQNVQVFSLNTSGLYLQKNATTEEFFLSRRTPDLQRYTFFRRYVTDYVREINEWKNLLEEHTGTDHTFQG